jgi:hypothetical protein
MKAYTDYPMTHLGDESGKEAPIREVFIHGWDGDKYVYLTVEGTVTSVKAGYIYPTPNRCGEVEANSYKLYKELSWKEIDELCDED